MALQTLKNKVLLNGKNLIGWKTSRKIVVICVDDYGNVRLDSKKARERMSNAGLPVKNRFDAFDALETKQDLEMLFDILESVTDKTGCHAVFTPFAVPCNIDFERIEAVGYTAYHYEILPQTHQKKADEEPESYAGAWKLWNEGMQSGLMAPQFHGREHLNLKAFEEKMNEKDHELLTQLKNRSFTGLSNCEYSTISPLAAFDFWDFEENGRFHSIVEDGLINFETVFGYPAEHFTPPGYKVHPVLYSTLKSNGIRWIDTALLADEHQGGGEYKRKFNYTGKIDNGLRLMVRNVVFEPTDDRGIDWPSYAMKQIEAAFRWNRPAIVSSHRVNFCGHIDPKNREKGLSALRELLANIIKRWPEVEFMTANELGKLIETE